jgi:F0F1-type ATP synthase assembly protein I
MQDMHRNKLKQNNVVISGILVLGVLLLAMGIGICIDMIAIKKLYPIILLFAVGLLIAGVFLIAAFILYVRRDRKQHQSIDE